MRLILFLIITWLSWSGVKTGTPIGSRGVPVLLPTVKVVFLKSKLPADVENCFPCVQRAILADHLLK